MTALQGASLLIYPTAIGWSPEEKPEFGQSQLQAWQTIQRAHAIANGVFVVSVNRVGTERMGDSEVEFWGHSFVADPFGNVVAEAGEGAQDLVVDLDLSLIEKTRQTWPFLRDRRIDAYAPLCQRWLA